MSIYSGFATRQQEQTYDQYVETIMYILQRRILKFYKGQDADEEKFFFILSKLHSQMKSMQGHKYLQPKSSNTFQQLLMFLKNRENAKLLNKNKIEGVSNQQFLITQNNEKKVSSNNDNQINIMPVTAPKKQEAMVSKIPQDFSQKYTERNLQGREIYKYEHKQSQSMVRPTTTQNQTRIKKISSYKNSHQSHNNSDIDSLSFFDQSSGLKKPKIQQKQDQNLGSKELKQIQKTFQLSKQPLQHILNPSASRFVGISRKQTRSHMNKSYQSIKSRKSTLKSKEKEKQTLENNNQQQQGLKQKGGESDVRDLIKGYISKTKKNYMRAYKKRKNQIDQMLKFI